MTIVNFTIKLSNILYQKKGTTMQKQDKIMIIYKNFVKDKFLSKKEITSPQIKNCKRIFSELLSNADTYSKTLLKELQTNTHAFIVGLECDLIDYTINYINDEKTE